MEMIPLTEICDEREEGEIIDDLEDVSDSSMFPGSPEDCGKSVSPPELLSAVCLSSISSNEYYRTCGRNFYDDIYNKKQWKHKRKRTVGGDMKRKNSHVRHRRRISIEIVSDSDTDYVDPNYAKQLKDALKRESPQELHNSLRTRLKGFIEPSSDDESNLNALRDIALHSTKSAELLDENKSESNDDNKPNKDLIKENFEDHELYQLRMAALKSVVMEKHEQRKKKNAKLEINSKLDSSDIDKENDQSIINNDVEVKLLKQQNTDTNNDCGSTKQEEQTVDKVGDGGDVMDEDVDILRAMLLANMTKTLATKFPTAAVASKELPKLEGAQVKTTTTELACVANHMIIKPLIINVNNDSDSDIELLNETENSFKDTVTQFLKKQRAEVEEIVKKKEVGSNKLDDTLMDKSVMKLLPHSQQLEYKQLKQRLINAKKKIKLRRTSQRISESKRDQGQIAKKLPKVKNDASGSGNTSNIKVAKSVQERKNTQSNTNLQKTLNELQIRKNGRLQMKGKYRSLGVLLHRINQASTVRRQYEIEVKKQLHELQKLRIKLATSHQNFTNLVQQLVKEKQVIDQRTYKIVKTPAAPVPVTSTPKQIAKTKVQQVQTSNSTIVAEKELLEPNDVTKVFVPELDAIPKYISPLDNRCTKDGIGINDPLMTLCPYDVLGTCKDKECQYMHCA